MVDLIRDPKMGSALIELMLSGRRGNSATSFEVSTSNYSRPSFTRTNNKLPLKVIDC